MQEIFKERMVPITQVPFVVFMFGIRLNNIWKIQKWLPVIRAKNRIIKELYTKKVPGFLGHESWIGNPIVTIQYWSSYEQLLAYAREKSTAHFPVWVAFNERYGKDGDLGIWHECYVIQEGCYEAVYKNMPAFGLGRATQIKPVKGDKIG